MYRMSGRRNCVVPACTSSQRELKAWRRQACSIHPLHLHIACECKEPFSLFSFPKNSVERRAWLRAVGKPINSLTRNGMVICSKHFIGGAPSEENPGPVLNLNSAGLAGDFGNHEKCLGDLHSPTIKQESNEIIEVIVGESDEGRDPTDVSHSLRTAISTEGRYPQGSWEQATVEAIMNLRSSNSTPVSTTQIAQTIIVNLNDENAFLRTQTVNLRSELNTMQGKHARELRDLQKRLEAAGQKCSCGAMTERTDSESTSVAKVEASTGGHSVKNSGSS